MKASRMVGLVAGLLLAAGAAMADITVETVPVGDPGNAGMLSTANGVAGQPVFSRVVDLGTMGWDESVALGVNNRGDIVGAVFTDQRSQYHACLWRDGGAVDLGTMLPGASSQASVVNDLGQIAGLCSYPDSGTTEQWGFILTPENGVYYRDDDGDGCNDLMVNLGDLGGGQRTLVYGLNDSGVVVGHSVAPPNLNKAYRWESGVMHDLGLPSEGCAYSINDRNQIVGQRVITGGYSYTAWQWESGTSRALGELPGGVSSLAYDISNDGVAAGWSTTSGNDPASTHAVMWVNDAVVDLGQLDGEMTFARAINGKNEVVGYTFTESWEPGAAFLWEDGVLHDLNSLIPLDAQWDLNYAADTNDFGWIVGSGLNPDGEMHAFLLIPEPATLSLLALCGMALVRRRWR